MRVHRTDGQRTVKLATMAVEESSTKQGHQSGIKVFCRETTIHGLRYIGAANLSITRRLFWIISVLIIFATCIWFSEWFIESYSAKAVHTTIDTTTAPLTDVFFPSVTACNVNQVQQSFLDFLNMTREQFELFEKEFIVGRAEPTSEAEKAAIDAIINSATVKNAYLSGMSQAFSITTQEIEALLDKGTVSIELGISRMAMQIQQGTMVPYAKYQDMELFHAITAYTGTDFGICAEIIPYLFNISANLFVQQPPALKDAEPGVTNGENNGMRLLLDAEVYDYAYKNRGGEGFKVALHHHRDVAVMRQSGFNVAPGTVVNVAVNPILSTTTQSAHNRFDPIDRDCYFEEEIALDHWPYNFTMTNDVSKRGQEGRYGMTNCLLEAALQKIAVDCQCAPSFHPLGYDLGKLETCQGYGITCVNKILDQIGDIDTIVDQGKTKKCLAPCEDQLNTFQLSFLSFPNKHTFQLRTEICILVRNIKSRCQNPVKRNLLNKNYPSLCDELQDVESQMNGNICNENWYLKPIGQDPGVDLQRHETLVQNLFVYARANLAMVNVFIKDPYVTRLKRDEAFPIIVFVAGFGGLLGVFTGFSFISLVEIIYYMGDAIVAQVINDPRRRRNERSRDSEKPSN